MKVKISQLSGDALDLAVAKCEGNTGVFGIDGYSPSCDWSQGGAVIDRESISVFRCDDENLVDAKGFCTNKYRPVWAAVLGDRHSTGQSYNGYGEECGFTYEISADEVVKGPTPLIAAMRCYVASKLGDEVDIPEELV